MPDRTTKIITIMLMLMAVNTLITDSFPPFTEYIIPSLIIWWALSKRADYLNGLRDKPEPRRYQLSLPEAYSATKFVLRTSTFGRARWSIQYDDKYAGAIDACVTVQNKVDLDGRREYFDQTVTLRVQVNSTEETTEVLLSYWVQSEGMGRSCANEVIDLTTEAIDTELANLEQAHQQLNDSAYEEQAS